MGQSYPTVHWLWGRDEARREHCRLTPWWLRLWVGLAQLADGLIAVCTLGLVTSAYGADAAVFALRWGLDKLNRDEEVSDGC